MDDIKIIELYFERNEQAINETDKKGSANTVSFEILE